MSRKKVTDALLNLDLVIAGTAFVILVGITFVGVLRRYFLNNPILWQEEVQLWLFLWIVFFGGSAAFRSRGHVAIEMVVELFPPKAQKAMDAAIYAVCVAALTYLFYNSYLLVSQFIANNKATSVIQIPNALISSAIPIGCVLMILNHTLVFVHDFFGKGEDEGEVGAV